jgi:hypothetical protein
LLIDTGLKAMVKLLDILSETKLFEMARYRKDAKDKVTSLSPQIFAHLLKFQVLELAQAERHWMQELDSWFYQIDDMTLKPTNSKPSKKDLVNWLWFDASPTYNGAYVTKIVKRMKATEYANVSFREINSDEVCNKIKEIISKVISDIAADNFESIEKYL